MSAWTSLLASWANKALSVARMNAYFGSGGNLDWLKDRTQAAITGGTLTISGGAVTVAPVDGYGRYPIDTEAAANTDDLDTINGGVDGAIVYLLAVNVARIIKITTAGNISLPPAPYNICLSSTIELGFRYDGAASKWRLLSLFDPNVELWKNNSGGSVALGDVLIFDKAGATQFTTTTIQGDKRVLGVSLETIANGAYGWIALRGRRQVNLNAAIALGQALITSTVAKQAIPNGGAVQDGYIGYAVDVTNSPTSCIAELNPQTNRTGGAVTQVSVVSSNSSTVSVTSSGTNRLLVAIVHHVGTGVISDVAFGGVGLTLAGGIGTTHNLSILYLLAPALTTANVVITPSGSTSDLQLTCIMFNDVNQSTPVGTATTGSGSTNAPSISGSANPGDYGIGAFCEGNETLTGRGAGQMELANQLGSSGTNRFVVDKLDPAPGSPAFTWTKSSTGAWQSVYLNVKPL
jgi:hypothetical protein